MPDLVRGPGQQVHLPANTTAGLPLSISNGAGIRTAEIQIRYDPALLSIDAATVGASMPAGATVTLNTSTAGTAALAFTSPADLPAGANVLVNLQASVPTAEASFNYGRQQALQVDVISLTDSNANSVSAIADDAIHLVTYFGDVSGNGRINASDAAQVARIAALLDSGFAATPLTDPDIAGDISGNRRVNAADASLVARFAALFEVPQIPPVPGGIVVAEVSKAASGGFARHLSPRGDFVPSTVLETSALSADPSEMATSARPPAKVGQSVTDRSRSEETRLRELAFEQFLAESLKETFNEELLAEVDERIGRFLGKPAVANRL